MVRKKCKMIVGNYLIIYYYSQPVNTLNTQDKLLEEIYKDYPHYNRGDVIVQDYKYDGCIVPSLRIIVSEKPSL